MQKIFIHWASKTPASGSAASGQSGKGRATTNSGLTGPIGSGALSSETGKSFVGDVPSVIEMAHWPHLEDLDGRTYPIRPGVNTVGREDTDIVVPDKSVSRHHGVIVYDESRDLYSIEDAGSLNGSKVNGDTLPSHIPRSIHPGDQISLGNIALRFSTNGYGENSIYAPDAASLDPTLPTSLDGSTSNMAAIARLELLRGDGPVEIYLTKGITTFGRNPDNSVCLSNDKHISGHHARIDAEGDLFLLVDVGSTNGTFLNGLRLTTNVAVAVSEGDEIRLGSVIMTFSKASISHDAVDTGVEPTVYAMPQE